MERDVSRRSDSGPLVGESEKGSAGASPSRLTQSQLQEQLLADKAECEQALPFGRKHPVHGVLLTPDGPTIVLLTVCTKNRQCWLADDAVHNLLRTIWREAGAWAVGRYVIMPDHIHLFISPANVDTTLDSWVRYWKSRFSKVHGDPAHRWQTDHWDTRLRHEESYLQKWEYVRNNPVRHRLVIRAEDWPLQGEIHDLRW